MPASKEERARRRAAIRRSNKRIARKEHQDAIRRAVLAGLQSRDTQDAWVQAKQAKQAKQEAKPKAPLPPVAELKLARSLGYTYTEIAKACGCPRRDIWLALNPAD
jgi:DNA-directed RNA polymerase specialized sigma24 family protein